MGKYEIGDSVKIKNDLEEGKWYSALVWLPEMQQRMGGKTVKITEITPSGDYLTSTGYYINSDMIEEKIND